jgi:ubiquinone biosynthesis monooxygenase Coq7
MTASAYPKWLYDDLRTDHAGETGAVWIYRGILSVSRDSAVRAFAERHLETETRHLRAIEDVLEPARRSRLLPIWRVAGFLTGALPSLIGPKSVFHTIEAVETFVDKHYEVQIQRLGPIEKLDKDLAAVRALLVDCQADEVAHRDEAGSLASELPGPMARIWQAIVARGSSIAVECARLI